jgi:predicted phage terminase large subunit-like protein
MKQPLPLMKFIPALTPRFTEPTHLAPLVDFFEAFGRGEEVRQTCHAPPRMMKTETSKHGLVRVLRANPALRVGLVMYSQTAAEKRSREIRALYQRAGGKLDADASSRKDWRTGVEDGGVWATSPGGPITGEGFDLVVIDDPVKDRATAESAIEREKLWSWFTDTLYTRLEPGGSVLVLGTRWHSDDLIGRLISDGWTSVVLPAIDDEGRSLCPERFTTEQLLKIKEQLGSYGWSSLYMGQPYSRGGAVFTDVHHYDVIPGERRQFTIGVDFAYSTKSRADYSVAVVLAQVDGISHVVEVIRMQVAAPDFLARLLALQSRYGGAKAVAYIGGQEGGVVDTMRALAPSFNIETRPATQDKFTRCQPVAAAWCAGKLLLPRKAFWLDAFVSEVVGFTGIGDRNDDQVDALAAAFDAQAESVITPFEQDFLLKQIRRLGGRPPAVATTAPRAPTYGQISATVTATPERPFAELDEAMRALPQVKDGETLRQVLDPNREPVPRAGVAGRAPFGGGIRGGGFFDT